MEKQEIKEAKAALDKYAEDCSKRGRKAFRDAVLTLKKHGEKIPVRRRKGLPADHEWEVFAELDPRGPFELKGDIEDAEIIKSSIEVLEVDPLDPKGYDKAARTFHEEFIVPGDAFGAWKVLEKSITEHAIELDKFEQAMAEVLLEAHPEIKASNFFQLATWAAHNADKAKAVLEVAIEDSGIMAALKSAVERMLSGDKTGAYEATESLRNHDNNNVALAGLALCS